MISAGAESDNDPRGDVPAVKNQSFNCGVRIGIGMLSPIRSTVASVCIRDYTTRLVPIKRTGQSKVCVDDRACDTH
jgi:hypothetical protein